MMSLQSIHCLKRRRNLPLLLFKEPFSPTCSICIKLRGEENGSEFECDNFMILAVFVIFNDYICLYFFIQRCFSHPYMLQ